MFLNSFCSLSLSPSFEKLLSLSHPHSGHQDTNGLMSDYIHEDVIGSEPWPGSTLPSSHPIPMFEMANGNGVARPENCKEASLEALLPLATVMLAEYREHTQVW